MIIWTTYPAEKAKTLQAVPNDILLSKGSADCNRVCGNILRLELFQENAKTLRGRRNLFLLPRYGGP